MNKTLKRNIFGLAAFVYMCMTTCLGYGWISLLGDKSHIYRIQGEDGTEEGQEGELRDEGYRWVDNLNLNIEDKEIEDGTTMERYTPNSLHCLLNDLTRAALNGMAGKKIQSGDAATVGSYVKHGAVCAVSLIVWSGDKYEIFNEILKDHEGKVIVAIPPVVEKEVYARDERGLRQLNWRPETGSEEYRFSMCYDYDSAEEAGRAVRKDLEGDDTGEYRCCEGQLLNRLLELRRDVNQRTLNKIVENIIKKNKIAPTDVKLVMLHIHSNCDPCGKCSRLLEKTAKYLNEERKVLSLENQIVPWQIMVSSSEPYYIRDKGKIVNSGACLSGRGHENDIWNINLTKRQQESTSKDDKKATFENMKLVFYGYTADSALRGSSMKPIAGRTDCIGAEELLLKERISKEELINWSKKQYETK